MCLLNVPLTVITLAFEASLAQRETTSRPMYNETLPYIYPLRLFSHIHPAWQCLNIFISKY